MTSISIGPFPLDLAPAAFRERLEKEIGARKLTNALEGHAVYSGTAWQRLHAGCQNYVDEVTKRLCKLAESGNNAQKFALDFAHEHLSTLPFSEQDCSVHWQKYIANEMLKKAPRRRPEDGDWLDDINIEAAMMAYQECETIWKNMNFGGTAHSNDGFSPSKAIGITTYDWEAMPNESVIQQDKETIDSTIKGLVNEIDALKTKAHQARGTALEASEDDRVEIASKEYELYKLRAKKDLLQ
ncbi:hypothetical protein I302_101347 [Kwoniella bestiolae CBS 10118]|uniref:Uncharacterized protein n=1 Tax=Kwoniella bestiolae CBS 10118 TaxID=1296100 RepID=A0A1B9GBZ4_9TREE|nr:hypothetical protein I302_00030 [Kwoniella bestiolae CBS 10118]OCF28543.1 hypothetical protein I302_00030 [Kwoniella bestiolae CBS 10118]